jgi:hypothetical protein
MNIEPIILRNKIEELREARTRYSLRRENRVLNIRRLMTATADTGHEERLSGGSDNEVGEVSAGVVPYA